MPDPLPDTRDKLAGYPVTVTFAQQTEVREVQLRLKDDKGADVPAYVSSPDEPANPPDATTGRDSSLPSRAATWSTSSSPSATSSTYSSVPTSSSSASSTALIRPSTKRSAMGVPSTTPSPRSIGVLSPAFLILWGPGLFRLTCYYYRKAYYRSFWLSPPACAVSEPHKKYSGETRFPLIAQNIHRYAWYFALIFAGILTWDAVVGFDFGGHFGIGVGSGILAVNSILIWGYTLGCHSCRHITAGRSNEANSLPYSLWVRLQAVIAVPAFSKSLKLFNLPDDRIFASVRADQHRNRL